MAKSFVISNIYIENVEKMSIDKFDEYKMYIPNWPKIKNVDRIHFLKKMFILWPSFVALFALISVFIGEINYEFIPFVIFVFGLLIISNLFKNNVGDPAQKKIEHLLGFSQKKASFIFDENGIRQQFVKHFVQSDWSSLVLIVVEKNGFLIYGAPHIMWFAKSDFKDIQEMKDCVDFIILMSKETSKILDYRTYKDH